MMSQLHTRPLTHQETTGNSDSMTPVKNERRVLLFLDVILVCILCASAAFSLVSVAQASLTQFIGVPGKQLTAMVGWIWNKPTEHGFQL